MSDDSAMELGAFQTLRRAVQSNAFPPSADDLANVVDRLSQTLAASGMFDNIEVEANDDPDAMVIAMCQFNPDLDEASVAKAVEALWEQEVRYPFWGAHSLIVEPGHVELEGATRAGASGHFATVHLVTQRGVIPAQREPSETLSRDTSIA